jgi:hypothetical protein
MAAAAAIEVEMERAEIAVPAAPAAHREQSFGQADREKAAPLAIGTAAVMSMVHESLLGDVSKIYLSCIFDKRDSWKFSAFVLCSPGYG